MSDGLLALAAGLTSGMAQRVQRNEDLDRQERMDALRTQEHGVRMRAMEGMVSDQERTRKENQGALDAGKDVPEEQDAPTAPAATASESLGSDASIDAAPSPSAALKAPSIPAPTGAGAAPADNGSRLLRAKGSGLNTPQARSERVAKYWESIGRADKADAERLAFMQNQEKLDTAQRTVALRTGMDFIARGDRAGLADKFYGSYNDGNTAEYVQGDGSAGSYVFKRDGQQIGKFDFKDDDELRQGLFDHYFPGQRMSRSAKLKDELELIDARGKAAAAARQAGIRPTGGGGYGGGSVLPRSTGSTKPTPDAAHTYLMNMVKEPKNGTMSEAQIGMAQAALGDIVANNPGIDPAHAAQAAYLYSQDPDKAAAPAFNPETGVFDDVVKTGVGAKVAIRRGVSSYKNLGGMTPEQAGAQVPMILSTLSDKFGVPQELLQKAAFDGVSRRDALDVIVGNVAKLEGFSSLSADEQKQRLKTARENADKLLHPSLSWIHNYGKQVKAPAAASTKSQASGGMSNRALDAINLSFGDPMDFKQ